MVSMNDHDFYHKSTRIINSFYSNMMIYIYYYTYKNLKNELRKSKINNI